MLYDPILLSSVLGGAIAVVFWSVASSSSRTSNRYYPPFAPYRIPGIGHLLHFLRPISMQELFRQWSLQLGRPVFTIQLGSKYWVVLNSIEAVQALIVQRSAIYSSRDLPDTLVNDLMDGVEKGGGFAFYPYGKEWRYLRRVAHAGLTKKKVELYQPILTQRRLALLQNVWRANRGVTDVPLTLTYFLEHYSMTLILTIFFGDTCSFQPGDQKLHEAFSLTERTAALLGPGEQLREFFPILKRVLPSTRSEFVNVRETIRSFYGELLHKAKQEEAQSGTQECILSEILRKNELTDLQIISFAGLFVGAGSETTATTLEWMVALLANHPQVQDKVFEEIKQNVGLDRLPDSSDEVNLPYLQCVILETLRFRAPAPLSLPHATSQDDVYEGCFIPAGTTVIMNLHAIHNDPVRYPEPEKFIPERHMDFVVQKTSTFAQTADDRPHLAFSTGRRVCVGIHLAEASVFLAAAGLLSCFRFECPGPLIDVDTPKDIRSPNLIPKPYRVCIVPRHDNLSKLLDCDPLQ